MPARPVLLTVAVLVVLALVGSSALRGHAPQDVSEWLSPIGPAVTVAGIGLWMWDVSLWRLRGVRKLHSRPVLHGTWHGELASGWINPETGKGVPVDSDVFLVIRQRFWHVSARLLTKESGSASMLGGFKADEDGVQRLVYVYANTPKAKFRYRSDMHLGGVVLSAPLDASAGLQGHYFTDRKTRGDLDFHTHRTKVVDSHRAGRALLESNS